MVSVKVTGKVGQKELETGVGELTGRKGQRMERNVTWAKFVRLDSSSATREGDGGWVLGAWRQEDGPAIC